MAKKEPNSFFSQFLEKRATARAEAAARKLRQEVVFRWPYGQKEKQWFEFIIMQVTDFSIVTEVTDSSMPLYVGTVRSWGVRELRNCHATYDNLERLKEGDHFIVEYVPQQEPKTANIRIAYWRHGTGQPSEDLE